MHIIIILITLIIQIALLSRVGNCRSHLQTETSEPSVPTNTVSTLDCYPSLMPISFLSNAALLSSLVLYSSIILLCIRARSH